MNTVELMRAGWAQAFSHVDAASTGALIIGACVGCVIMVGLTVVWREVTRDL